MILQCEVRADRQSAEPATDRTRDLLHITNAQHGAGNRAILVSSAGQQADGGRSGRKPAPQMPLRGRTSHRLDIRKMRVTWWSYGDSNSGPLACHTHSARRHMWLGVALHGDHLRLPWLDVAWPCLVPVHVGSPTGSQSS